LTPQQQCQKFTEGLLNRANDCRDADTAESIRSMGAQCLAQPNCVEGVTYSSQKAEQCLASIGAQSCGGLLMLPESCLSILGCLLPKGMSSGGTEPSPTDFVGTWNGFSQGGDSTTTWSLSLNSDRTYQLTSTQQYRSDIAFAQAGCRVSETFIGSWNATGATVSFPANVGTRIVEQCTDPSMNQDLVTLSAEALATLNQSNLKAAYDSQQGTLAAVIAPGAILRR
jgi:hypothetical protein